MSDLSAIKVRKTAVNMGLEIDIRDIDPQMDHRMLRLVHPDPVE